MTDELTQKLIAEHLSDLHKERWAETWAELMRRLDAAEGDERDAVQHQLDIHYNNRHRPETSRAAILQAVEENTRKRTAGADDGSKRDHSALDASR